MKKPGKRLYTIEFEYADGRKVKDEHIYKFESEWYIDNTQQIIIACHDPGTPSHFPLEDGMTIRITEENVKTP